MGPVRFTVKLQGRSDSQGFPVHYTGYIIENTCTVYRDFTCIMYMYFLLCTLYNVQGNPVNHFSPVI